jgi:hypothetical protein
MGTFQDFFVALSGIYSQLSFLFYFQKIYILNCKQEIGWPCGAVVIVWYLDLQLPVQLVPIATKVVCLNPFYGEVYSVQHYVIKFVSDLRQVCGFLRVIRFPPSINLTALILLKYC